MTTDLTELNKLEAYLKANGYVYFRHDREATEDRFDWHQIIVKDGWSQWDAVCHYASYGYESGLLEVMGSIVEDNQPYCVDGYLTADDIIKRLECRR